MWEPPTRLDLDTRPRPRTAPDLLRDLGVQNALPAEQRSAVNGWLIENPADELLRVSLRRKGLPSAPLAVTAPSTRYVKVMGGTATIVSVNAWEEHSFVVFPKALTGVRCSFFSTGAAECVIAGAREEAGETVQVRRLRDGTRVA
jgi:hypothetical protein